MLFELIALLTGTVVISLIAGFVVVFVATYMFQNREKSNIWAHNLLVDGIFIFYSVLAIGVVISPAMFILKPFIFIYEITVRLYNEGLTSVLTSPTLDENETMHLAQLQARFDAFFNTSLEPIQGSEHDEEFFDCTEPPVLPPTIPPQTLRSWYVAEDFPQFNDGYGRDPYGQREFARAFGVSVFQVNSW